MLTNHHAIRTISHNTHGDEHQKSEINGFICNLIQPGTTLTYTGLFGFNFKKLHCAPAISVTEIIDNRITAGDDIT